MIALATLLLLLQASPPGTPPASAPQAAPAGANASAATALPADSSADYQVGPGDVLEVTVFGNEDLSRVPTVQTNGAISLPLLGEVPVAGRTLAQVQQEITARLGRDYLVNPQVEVRVREYHSQFVSVVGEVGAPGRKPLRGRTRLIDALVEAGGFTPRASGEVLIARTDGAFAGGSRTLVLRISGGATPSAQDAVNLELPLRNGDIITASPKYYVTVDGEVNRPGRYPIEADLTVTGAVSLAGGLTRYGSNTVKVRRTESPSGKVRLIEVDLKDVRNGKKPDLPLQPNDVLSVPRRVF